MNDCEECRNCLKQVREDLITMFEEQEGFRDILERYFNTIASD